VINNKYKNFKTLVLKLKPNAVLNQDHLDAFVDQMIGDLQNTLLSNSNDIRERIKQTRSEPNDPQYTEKMIIYKELLEQMILLMQKLQNTISQTLDEFHTLIEQLWNDISNNNGKNVDHLLEEHERHMNEKWMKDINKLEAKLKTMN
jgi:gas vesicle protein